MAKFSKDHALLRSVRLLFVSDGNEVTSDFASAFSRADALMQDLPLCKRREALTNVRRYLKARGLHAAASVFEAFRANQEREES